MIKIIAVLLSVAGFVLIYLSHTNQALLRQALARFWRRLGYLLCLIGLWLMCWGMAKLVAVLMWLAICTLIFSFLPLLSIFKKGRP